MDLTNQPAAIQQLQQQVIQNLTAAITQIQLALQNGIPAATPGPTAVTATSNVFLPEGYGDTFKSLAAWFGGSVSCSAD
ncbi:MAG: hypothetical protein AB7H97_17440, partial [Pseudobdellovibrionaceae bacterium]